MDRPQAKPLITANQVTLARLALLPFGSWLMYQGRTGQLISLIFMTLVGCTDFVDGWLARKYGPTVLGGLMDPIADKVFIVVVFLPYIDLGWLPPWLVGLLLLREFLVTGLRSAYERRGLKLRTTLLAKIKTWVQMGGAGVLFMMQVFPPRLMESILLAGVLLPVVFAAIRYLARRYLWSVAFVFTAWFAGTLIPYVLWGRLVASELLMLSMLAVTWISGWGYLSQAMDLLSAKPLDRSDWVRIVAAIAVPLVVVTAQSRGTLPSLALIIALSLEMAVGGLDNLLCHHHAQSSTLAWGLRTGLLCLLVGAAVVAVAPGSVLPGLGLTGSRLAYAGCAVSLLGTAWEFLRGRNYYLDSRLQNQPLE